MVPGSLLASFTAFPLFIRANLIANLGRGKMFDSTLKSDCIKPEVTDISISLNGRAFESPPRQK
jgi:hypothetical protein